MNSNEKYKNKTSLMPKAEGSELRSLKRFNVLYWFSIWVMCTKWRAEKWREDSSICKSYFSNSIRIMNIKDSENKNKHPKLKDK